MSALQAHLETGTTHVCRAWAVTRRDGRTFGFTDHDGDLEFDGIVFRADTGMTASALVQGTGLSVDNTEGMGVLSDGAITEADIRAGRFDGAEVRAWIVRWDDVTARRLRFRGHVGEIRRGAGAFHAELRGLTDRLNQPQGRVYQTGCGAVLGDAACRFDPDREGFAVTLDIAAVDGGTFTFEDPVARPEGWFERGRLRVLSGAADGLIGVVKTDVAKGGKRVLDLWEPLQAELRAGDRVRIEPGCDKRFETCRKRFDNAVNFQGFPYIPGDDWIATVPRGEGRDDGGSLFSWVR